MALYFLFVDVLGLSCFSGVFMCMKSRIAWAIVGWSLNCRGVFDFGGLLVVFVGVFGVSLAGVWV